MKRVESQVIILLLVKKKSNGPAGDKSSIDLSHNSLRSSYPGNYLSAPHDLIFIPLTITLSYFFWYSPPKEKLLISPKVEYQKLYSLPHSGINKKLLRSPKERTDAQPMFLESGTKGFSKIKIIITDALHT